MKIVIQRVINSSLIADGIPHSEINHGLLLMVGIMNGDTRQDAEVLAKKVAQMRIFSDDDGKMNLSAEQVNADIMVVSNFTLGADCSKRRPYFGDSAKPDVAKELYEYFVEQIKTCEVANVVTGVFGADMKITTTLDGPVTILL